MSAREDALGPMQRDMLGELRRRYDAGTAEAGLAALREEIAHELAEKQRAELRRQGYDLGCACETCSACLATEYIGLIDPAT